MNTMLKDNLYFIRPDNLLESDNPLQREAKWNCAAGAEVRLVRHPEFDDDGRLIWGFMRVIWPDTGEQVKWTYAYGPIVNSMGHVTRAGNQWHCEVLVKAMPASAERQAA